jgi:hypothetical protein
MCTFSLKKLKNVHNLYIYIILIVTLTQLQSEYVTGNMTMTCGNDGEYRQWKLYVAPVCAVTSTEKKLGIFCQACSSCNTSHIACSCVWNPLPHLLYFLWKISSSFMCLSGMHLGYKQKNDCT